MQFVDTHCHIQLPDYGLDPEQVIADAAAVGVDRYICVGCTLEDSTQGIAFAAKHDGGWASIGLHPHEAEQYVGNQALLDEFAALATAAKVVAVGECGLDYYYNHAAPEAQVALLRFQLELAQAHDLPLIFHVREAFDDFWPIFEEFNAKKPLRGVLHSYTDNQANLERAIAHGLFIGVNGIATFARADQQAVYASIPSAHLLLETDAPFLTPAPHRGTINQLQYVRNTAEFLANLRGEGLEALSEATTKNAQTLFNLT